MQNDPSAAPTPLPPPAPSDDSPDAGAKSLTLTPEQLSALGIGDCAPGDSYTIRVTKSDGDGMFAVDGVDAPISQEPDTDDASESTLPPVDEPPADDSTPPDDEEKMLGYKRSKRTTALPYPADNLKEI